MSWKSLDEMTLKGQTVLVRVDINVPVDGDTVTDFTRIDRIKPTLEDILSKGGKPVLLAHFGRPKGQKVPEMSLAPVAKAMKARLGLDIRFSPESKGAVALDSVETLPEGAVLVLENTRFHPGEEKNDEVLAREFAQLGDIYCNDAFSAAHRAHASTEALARLLPSCAGRLMQAELEALENALSTPERPVAAVVGGAKVSTKLDLLSNMMERVDMIVIGGGMANTFLAAQGHDVGKSLHEADLLDTARKIMKSAEENNVRLILPSDVVIAREFKAGAPSEIVAANACPPDAMILDAGPDAVEDVKAAFKEAKTLVWNGPLGAFEIEPFHKATDAAAAYAAERTVAGHLLSVAGGGDTVAALNSSGAAEKFSYVSSAGGAFLEWLEGKTLPGIAALSN